MKHIIITDPKIETDFNKFKLEVLIKNPDKKYKDEEIVSLLLKR